MSSPKPRTCAVVLTQIDQYQSVLQQCGSWEQVASQFLPHVHDAYLVNGKIALLPVSAVGATTVADEQGIPRRVPDWNSPAGSPTLDTLMEWLGNAVSALGGSPPQASASSNQAAVADEQGISRRVPDWNSPAGSPTLDTLMEWLSNAVSALGGSRPQASALSNQAAIETNLGHESPATALPWVFHAPPWMRTNALWIIAGLGFFVMWGSCSYFRSDSPSATQPVVPSQPAKPDPKVLRATKSGLEGLFQDTAILDVHVVNRGLAGTVVVHGYFYERGAEVSHQQQPVWLATDEERIIQLRHVLPSLDWEQAEAKYFVEIAP